MVHISPAYVCVCACRLLPLMDPPTQLHPATPTDKPTGHPLQATQGARLVCCAQGQWPALRLPAAPAARAQCAGSSGRSSKQHHCTQERYSRLHLRPSNKMWHSRAHRNCSAHVYHKWYTQLPSAIDASQDVSVIKRPTVTSYSYWRAPGSRKRHRQRAPPEEFTRATRQSWLRLQDVAELNPP
jgi:hypothetical protein